MADENETKRYLVFAFLCSVPAEFVRGDDIRPFVYIHTHLIFLALLCPLAVSFAVGRVMRVHSIVCVPCIIQTLLYFDFRVLFNSSRYFLLPKHNLRGFLVSC